MTFKQNLALGQSALAIGSLNLVSAFATRFSFPFTSLEFSRGFFIGYALVLCSTGVVLMLSAACAQQKQPSTLAPRAK